MKKTTWFLGTLFMAAHAADAFLTLWATNNGFQEVNPLMVPFAHTWAFPFIKLVPALVGLFIVSKLTARFPRFRPLAVVGLASSVAFLGGIIIANIGEII